MEAKLNVKDLIEIQNNSYLPEIAQLKQDNISLFCVIIADHISGILYGGKSIAYMCICYTPSKHPCQYHEIVEPHSSGTGLIDTNEALLFQAFVSGHTLKMKLTNRR